MRAAIRNLWGEETDVEIDELGPTAWAVPVAGFGHLVFVMRDDGPAAVLAQGPGRGEHPRSVHTIDSTPDDADPADIAAGTVEPERRYEVELLPNRSGEDRIVVVLRP